MAVQDATAFPVYGQAYREEIAVYDATTGQPVTLNLSTSGITISLALDGVSTSPTGLITTSLSQITGVLILDLTAACMTANTVTIYVSCTNISNSFSPVKTINPLKLGSTASKPWWEQAPLLFEQITVQNNAFLFNANQTVGGAVTVFNRDGTTLATGTLQAGQTGTVRSQLS
jgi:hypothetical protein